VDFPAPGRSGDAEDDAAFLLEKRLNPLREFRFHFLSLRHPPARLFAMIWRNICFSALALIGSPA